MKFTVGKKNKFKYLLLSQDEDLHEHFLEKVVQLPIMFFQNNSVLQIKPVSAALKLKIERKRIEKEKQMSIGNRDMRRERAQIRREDKEANYQRLKKQRNKLGVRIKKKSKKVNAKKKKNKE